MEAFLVLGLEMAAVAAWAWFAKKARAKRRHNKKKEQPKTFHGMFPHRYKKQKEGAPSTHHNDAH